MHHESDIFCLREVKKGENDGSHIFSVNGAMSRRLTKRNTVDGSNAFQYGSSRPTSAELAASQMEQRIAEKTFSKQPPAAESPTGIADNSEDIENIENQQAVRNDNPRPKTANIEKPIMPTQSDSVVKGSDISETTEKKAAFKKRMSEEQISISRISRNPLTGAGYGN